MRAFRESGAKNTGAAIEKSRYLRLGAAANGRIKDKGKAYMREIIERINEIEREQKRRAERDFLSKYNAGGKVHEKQLAFHKCLKKNRWVFGGNRSGKTECGAVETVYMARGIHPYRENRKDAFGWVVSLSAQVQRDVAQAKILHYLDSRYIDDVVMISGKRDSPAYGVIDQIRVKNAFGGISTIGFKSCDQGREKFQGSSLDFVWFDEEPPQDVYEECRMRVLDRSGDIFGTMTPLKGMTYIYDEIYLNSGGSDEVWYEFMEWADNPYLSAKEVDEFTRTLSAEQLETRRYGRFKSASGLVYPEFDENVHVIEPLAYRRRRQHIETGGGQTRLHSHSREIRRTRLRPPLRTGRYQRHNGILTVNASIRERL